MATTTVTKDNVFDRQDRFLGANTREILMRSSICLIGATAAGSEALKSLVLAGLGSFTVVDSAVVTNSDLGKNFFVDVSDAGHSRAEAVAKKIKIHGIFVEDKNVSAIFKDPIALLNESPLFYKKFDLLIASGIPSPHLHLFGKFAAENSIQLINIRAFGQIGVI